MLYAYKKDNEWIAISPAEYKKMLGLSIPESYYEKNGLFVVTIGGIEFNENTIPKGKVIVDRDGRPVLEWMERARIPEDDARIQNMINLQIDQEKIRRIIESKAFEINNKFIVMDGYPATLLTLTSLATLANIDPNAIEYRDSNNVHHKLEAVEIIELFKQVMKFNSDLHKSAWHLKSLDKLPEDYHDDKWWVYLE